MLCIVHCMITYDHQNSIVVLLYPLRRCSDYYSDYVILNHSIHSSIFRCNFIHSNLYTYYFVDCQNFYLVVFWCEALENSRVSQSRGLFCRSRTC